MSNEQENYYKVRLGFRRVILAKDEESAIQAACEELRLLLNDGRRNNIKLSAYFDSAQTEQVRSVLG